MPSPTPSASCLPCCDTPLAWGGALISFATFAYAFIVGMIYYYRLAKRSPDDIKKYTDALSSSLNELQITGERLVSILWDFPHLEKDQNEIKQMKSELDTILPKLERQIRSLQRVRKKVDSNVDQSSRGGGAAWFKSMSRMYYLLIWEEVQKEIVEKDRVMMELRHLHERAEKITHDKLEYEHREKQNEMLKLIRAERADDVKSQALFWSEHERVQDKQIKMLESILRRLEGLEAQGRRTAQGETSSSDPPPESTN